MTDVSDGQADGFVSLLDAIAAQKNVFDGLRNTDDGQNDRDDGCGHPNAAREDGNACYSHSETVEL